jgi:hypothetical protein
MKTIVCIIITVGVACATLCEHLGSITTLQFTSTQKTQTNSGDSVYEIICVGQCEKDWNERVPPLKINCEKIATEEWTCFNQNSDLAGGYSISCESCGDPTQKDWVLKHSCSLELERWAVRGL